jgi:hypothetical protein
MSMVRKKRMTGSAARMMLINLYIAKSFRFFFSSPAPRDQFGPRRQIVDCRLAIFARAHKYCELSLEGGGKITPPDRCRAPNFALGRRETQLGLRLRVALKPTIAALSRGFVLWNSPPTYRRPSVHETVGPPFPQHQGERLSVGGGGRLREEHRMDQMGRTGTTIRSM